MSFDPKHEPQRQEPIVYIGDRRYSVIAFNPARSLVQLRTLFNFHLIAPLSAISLTPVKPKEAAK